LAMDHHWVSDGSGRRHRITVIMESRRNGPQLSSRHDDDDDVILKAWTQSDRRGLNWTAWNRSVHFARWNELNWSSGSLASYNQCSANELAFQFSSVVQNQFINLTHGPKNAPKYTIHNPFFYISGEGALPLPRPFPYVKGTPFSILHPIFPVLGVPPSWAFSTRPGPKSKSWIRRWLVELNIYTLQNVQITHLVMALRHNLTLTMMQKNYHRIWNKSAYNGPT